MPKFVYVARDVSGKRMTGSMESATEDEVITRLQSMNLTVVDVLSGTKEEIDKFLPGSSSSKRAYKIKRHYGVKSSDLVLLCRQLTTLLGAGVTILKSLETISKQVASQKLYLVLERLKKNMEQGMSFHEALGKHPEIFSDLWVNLVESGEASGNLAVVLDRLATYLERNAAFKSKLISSMIYPAILMFASVGALLFLTIKIVPTFAEVFKSFTVAMPAPTQLLINFSYAIRKFFVPGLIGMGIMIYLLKQYLKTKEGRRTLETFLYKLPVAGEFFRALSIERFSSEMSTLVESGVPILYSLEIAEASVGSVLLADIIHKVKDDVRNGRPLSTPLENSGFFEPMVVQMVTIGEEIGELSQMFKRINGFYQEYVETFLGRFVAMFEPMILIFMGGVIGLMVIGMFLPIFNLSKIGGG